MVLSLRLFPLLLLVLAGLLPPPAGAAYASRIPAVAIDDALALFFPLRAYASDSRLILKRPRVTLREGSGEIRLTFPVVATVPGHGRLRGQAELALSPAYKGITGEIFLGQPRGLALDLPGLAAARLAGLRSALEDELVRTLPLVRIGRVDEADLNHSLEKSVILSWRVGDGHLLVTIGFR